MRTNCTHTEICNQLNAITKKATDGSYGENKTAPARNHAPLKFDKIVRTS